MNVRRLIAHVVVAAFACASGVTLAANALIVHDGTAGLEANVVANLSTQLTTATYTVTTNVGIPAGSLAGYKQIWDVRFNNTTPLSAGDISTYVTYMAGGGSLFVMGENTGFITRDNSIAALITAAGGGTITITSPANAETVLSPFNLPNAVSSVTFLAAAGTTSPGTGALITRDAGGIGASAVWSPGTMAAAPAGTLIVVFDVNFLDPGSGYTAGNNMPPFVANLIAFLAAPTPIGVNPVPALSTWALAALGLLLAGVAVRFLASRGA